MCVYVRGCARVWIRVPFCTRERERERDVVACMSAHAECIARENECEREGGCMRTHMCTMCTMCNHHCQLRGGKTVRTRARRTGEPFFSLSRSLAQHVKYEKMLFRHNDDNEATATGFAQLASNARSLDER